MKLAKKILTGLVLAAVAYFWATALMDALFGFRSPLKDQPPQPLAAAGSPLTERVVFVLVDGLRLDTALEENVMPTLAGLRQQGAWAASRSRPPSYSQTGYTVLLTGAWPSVSDGPAINLDYENIYTFTQDDLFSAADAAGLKTAISGYNWFEKLVPQSAVDTSFYTPLEDRTADEQVVQAALPWLESGAYQLILIHLDQVDYAGHHEGGPLDPRWNEAARRVDDHLAQIVSRLDLSRDTLFLTSDHGHIDRGGHGGQDSIVLIEPFLLAGAGITPGTYPDVNMADIAPTLAALLGAGIPASAQGQPLLEMLAGDSAVEAQIQKAYEVQQSQLLDAYARAANLTIEASTGNSQAALEAAVNQRLLSESLPRLGAVLAGLIVAGWLFWRLRSRKEMLWFLAGTLVFWLFFHAKYALLDSRTYSLSSVLSSDDIILSTALTSALALLAGWIITVLGLKLWKVSRSTAATYTANFSLVVLFSLLLVVAWNYYRNGILPTWTLPADFNSEFLGFLSLLQILFVGVLLPILCGIAALFGRRSSA